MSLTDPSKTTWYLLGQLDRNGQLIEVAFYSERSPTGRLDRLRFVIFEMMGDHDVVVPKLVEAFARTYPHFLPLTRGEEWKEAKQQRIRERSRP